MRFIVLSWNSPEFPRCERNSGEFHYIQSTKMFLLPQPTSLKQMDRS